jgi:hypothetical protein
MLSIIKVPGERPGISPKSNHFLDLLSIGDLPDAGRSVWAHARSREPRFREEQAAVRSDRFDQLIRRFAGRKEDKSRSAQVITEPCGGPDDFCPEGGVVDPRITTIVMSIENCLSGDDVCASDADCCSGVCTMHGRCGCFDVGHLCPNDGYCCSGNCQNHRCV